MGDALRSRVARWPVRDIPSWPGGPGSRVWTLSWAGSRPTRAPIWRPLPAACSPSPSERTVRSRRRATTFIRCWPGRSASQRLLRSGRSDEPRRGVKAGDPAAAPTAPAAAAAPSRTSTGFTTMTSTAPATRCQHVVDHDQQRQALYRSAAAISPSSVGPTRPVARSTSRRLYVTGILTRPGR